MSIHVGLNVELVGQVVGGMPPVRIVDYDFPAKKPADALAERTDSGDRLTVSRQDDFLAGLRPAEQFGETALGFGSGDGETMQPCLTRMYILVNGCCGSFPLLRLS